jgi:hypothetical protein
VTHDQRLADENADWEELTADGKLARLNGFVLERKSCQCEECLWEYASVLGDFGIAAIPFLSRRFGMNVSPEEFGRNPTRNRLAVLLARTDHASHHFGQMT